MRSLSSPTGGGDSDLRAPNLGMKPRQTGLTDFLYQRVREIIAFARPGLAVAGTGSLSVARVAGIRWMSAV
jgi:hypothetical protein